MGGDEHTKAPAWARLLRQAWRSSRLIELGPRGARRMRSLWLSGLSLLLFGGLSVVGMSWLAPDAADLVALRVASYACWLFGALGLWTLLSPGAVEHGGIARLRGVEPHPAVVTGLTLFRSLLVPLLVLGMPGVVLALSLAPGWSLEAALGVLGHVLLYLLSLSAGLAVVGALCVWWTGRGARWAAALVLLVPFVASVGGAEVPSLVGFFVDWMSYIMGTGPSV